MRPHRNRALFSNYYLDELLPKEEEFNIPISEVKAVFEKVKGIWDKSRFEAINEDQLRKHFLDKVLDYLGWIVDVEAPIPSGEWSKRPDYAFFLNNESLKTSQKGKKDDYFKKVTCVGEAKRLGRPLDKKLKTEADPFEVQNPSLQISRYLWLTGVKWGILTDGKYWRLYERETSKRLDIFYEIDLEDLIESGTPEDFRYFYLLFRRDAFPEFIEKVYKGSVDYAEEVGKELKENIYQALKTLTQGFLKTSGNNLSEEHLKEIHDNSLILLYRLLFILYAEHRDLLPLRENKLYTDSYSLDSFKKEIANKLDKNVPIASSTIGYWNKLKGLFEIINKGNRELGVPPYNGGLFDPEKHYFLENYRVGDLYVAKAIDLLSRSKDKAYIDYGSLEIRHLGSIYEGLLEYKLKIADQDLVPIKDKGKELFVSLTEAKKQKKTIREDEKILAGEIYLVTDKGERKTTGSYYTPDYIVKYIIENTLGPLVEEKRKKVSENIEELKKKIKGSRGASREFLEKELRKTGGSLIDEILSLKVLDPAMGSGHFLVEATDFLARKLLEVLSGEPLEEHKKEMVVREPSEPYGLKESEEDIRWARREVVERCIFGVDLNPMAVELAKLSLWLYTVAKNRPLNFLDHHLRCGNSLIGAKIDDLSGLPELKKKKAEGAPAQLGLFESIFKEKVNILLGAFAQIEMLPSDTVEQVTEKEKLYQDFRKIVSRFQVVADVWTSIYFGNDLSSGNYQKLQNRLRSSNEEWEKLTQEEWLRRAKTTADEKRFFHWELEFPEIFFEGHQRKENPGFDCVIGNPPYVSFGLGRTQAIEKNKEEFYRLNFESAEYKISIYTLFIECGVMLAKNSGRISYIIPDSFLVGMYFSRIRNYLLKKTKLDRFIVFNKDFWESGDVGFPTIFIVEKLLFDDISDKWDFIHSRCDTPELLSFGVINYVKQKQINLLSNHRFRFHFFEEANIGGLLEKLKKISLDLDMLLSLHHGIRSKIGRDKIISETEKDISWKKAIISSSEINRFVLCPDVNYINVNPEFLFTGGWAPDHIEQTKILIRRTGDSIISVVDTHYYYHTNALIYGVPTEKGGQFNLYFEICILNSKLIDWFYRNKTMKSGRTLPQVEIDTIEKLPIRRLSFVTSKESRKKLFEEAKNHYKKFLETSKPDIVLRFIESRIKREHKPDTELVKKHNADPLNKDWQISEGILWEQSDVVHDTLAFLAEQMIEMNKEKQGEIKGYLGWLESQLKIQSDADGNSGIEALTGKTQINNYLGDYQKGEEDIPFEEFWKILETNKTKIQANLKSRELYENIKSDYEKSLSKLLPLKEKLHKTDWLIDQIVYKLYGLTEDEIKKVEQG